MDFSSLSHEFFIHIWLFHYDKLTESMDYDSLLVLDYWGIKNFYDVALNMCLHGPALTIFCRLFGIHRSFHCQPGCLLDRSFFLTESVAGMYVDWIILNLY